MEKFIRKLFRRYYQRELARLVFTKRAELGSSAYNRGIVDTLDTLKKLDLLKD